MKKFEKIDLGLKEAYNELFMNDEERIFRLTPSKRLMCLKHLRCMLMVIQSQKSETFSMKIILQTPKAHL